LVLSAATLGLQIEWIEGVLGDEIANKSLPPKMEDANLSSGVKGCWRAHMDAYHAYVFPCRGRIVRTRQYQCNGYLECEGWPQLVGLFASDTGEKAAYVWVAMY